ncbi:MAG: cysteine--tRNA ligase, partial [Simkania sp.]|nr:cysteine--tRNA ligase [Simkania sp.]
MTLHIYNTESREKEPITLAPHKKEIALYTCGPTVYNFAHIGNFRTYVFEDLFRRTLEFFGLKVKQVMNLTDVDDKTIKGALEKRVSLDEFTQFYKRAFFEDLKTLGIQKAHLYPSAIDYIPQMIAMIQHLIKKGLAYKGKEGSVYFSIRHFPAYGKLSHLCLSELKAGASERVTTDEYEKESIADFVLWKGYDPERDGDIYWESPFGKGRPGWHIECSAMATELLGETIDIHMGGVDNIFPHHENEIAQSEGCSGKMFSRYWVHAEHLIVNGKKMSKSLGNFFTLRDLLDKGYSGTEVRYLLLSTHYRTQLNFTLEGLNAARQSLQRLEDFGH